MTLFKAATNAVATSAAPVLIASTNASGAIKTLLQIQTPSSRGAKIVAMGIEFATALTIVGTVELIDTFAVAATVTAHVAAGVQPYDDQAAGAAVSAVTLGTAATGYNATAEGTITAARDGKTKVMPIGSSEYEWEWSFGREFCVPPSHNVRIRCTGSASTSLPNAYAWILYDE